MGRRAEILVTLVDESVEKSNDLIVKEIFEELQKYPQIPWVDQILQVIIREG